MFPRRIGPARGRSGATSHLHRALSIHSRRKKLETKEIGAQEIGADGSGARRGPTSALDPARHPGPPSGREAGRGDRAGDAMRAFDRFWKAVEALLALLLVAMICLVFANVVLRYGFASGLRPSIELSRLSFVWLVLLGAAVVLRREEHLAVSEFAVALAPRAVPVLRRLAYVVIAVAVGMLALGAWRQMNANWGNVSQITGLPSALLYLPGVIAGALMAAIAVVRIVRPDALRPAAEDHVDPVE